jgi:hypothetical protein
MVRREGVSDTEFMSSIAVPIPTTIMTIIQPRTYGYSLLLTVLCDLFAPRRVVYASTMVHDPRTGSF